MRTESIAVDVIEVGDRLRAADPDKVATLAASISDLGLRTPITVRSIAIPEKDEDDNVRYEYRFVLVAGLHRLEAGRSLGWDFIDCYVMENASESDARLWEIAENLHRADLSVQERSDQVAEWVRLTEEKLAQAAPASQPAGGSKKLVQVEPVSPSKGGRGKEGGMRAAERDLGLNHSEVHRAVKIASIAPEAKKAAADAGVKSQKDLLEVSKAPVDQQVTKVNEIAERRSKPMAPAPEPRNDIEVEEAQLTALMNAWNKASRIVRERFLETVQSPVFDTASRSVAGVTH